MIAKSLQNIESDAVLDEGARMDGASRRNRRSSRRSHATRVEVAIVEDNGECIPFDCFDLSSVGIYLHSEYLMYPGEDVRLRIRLPSRIRSLDVRGVVVRAETGDEDTSAGMGIAFRGLAVSEQQELERFLMRRFLGHA